MPYPPPRPRKSEEELKQAQEARARALVPHRFAPGRSGNLHGMSRDQHALYRETRQLRAKLGPLVERRLAELSGIEFDEAGEPALVPLAEAVEKIDPRVMAVAVNALDYRIFGKPREGGEEAGGLRAAEQLDLSRLSPEEIETIAAAAQLLARARVQPQEPPPLQVIDGEVGTSE